MTTIERYNKQIEVVRSMENIDDLAKKTMVEALEMKRDAVVRAEKAKRTRATEQLFISHFANGCPECSHNYRPSDEEIDSLIALREAGSVKL